MARPLDKRSRLILAANRLFHSKGYERSSIADIAQEAGVPLGNVYYYFKTKEALVDAVIARREAFISAWLAEIDAAAAGPLQRLSRFVDEFENSADLRAKHGCPVGGLCQDTNRISGELARRGSGPFKILIDWLQNEFASMDGSSKISLDRAHHVLVCLEGASLLAQTFQNPDLLKAETARIKNWVHALPGVTLT